MAHNLDITGRIERLNNLLLDHELNSAEFTHERGLYYELPAQKREAGWLAVQKQSRAEARDLLRSTWDKTEGLAWKAQARLEARREKALATIDAGLDFQKLMYNAGVLPGRIEGMRSLSELQTLYAKANPTERRVIQDLQPVIRRKFAPLGTEGTLGSFLAGLQRDLDASRRTPEIEAVEQDAADLDADLATLHQLSMTVGGQIDPGLSRSLTIMVGVKVEDTFDPQVGLHRATFRPNENAGGCMPIKGIPEE